LLREIFTSLEYKKEEFPFYEYFYYIDYLNGKYLSEKLSHMDQNKYPVLKDYLELKNIKKYNNYYLVNLNLFNNVFYLLMKNIQKKYHAKKKIKEEDIYFNNKNLIDKFITFYNNLNLQEAKILSIDNPLCDFLLVSDNKFGINYINIYKKFAKEQNEKLEN
jgi:hypothetical protein